ncbi:MAG: hypothetical protein HYU69_12785 [Bacteroidetes bacterium]|nr:hypothetical protein [Bacteroidota bacterium]
MKIGNQIWRWLFAIILQVFLCRYFFGQDTTSIKEPAAEYVEEIFTGTQLINSQTTTVLQSKSRTFGIQHRFGKVGIDSSLVQQFLGFDLPSVIRLSLGWSISDRLYLMIGRTNYYKTVDIEGKYLLVRQTNGFKTPVSIALFNNTSIRTEKFPNVSKGAFYENSGVTFSYKPSHRLIYNTQLIVSSKLSERLTLLFTPIFIYQNLVGAGYENYTLIFSGGGRFKFGLNSSVIFEYAHGVNNRHSNFYNPVSLGVEFGTVGHVFQIFISNNGKILENHVYTSGSANIQKGEFFLGFNTQRKFWKKSRLQE